MNTDDLLKPGKHFKLSSTTKYLLSTITDDHARAVFRQNMIQAQLQGEIRPASKEDKKK